MSTQTPSPIVGLAAPGLLWLLACPLAAQGPAPVPTAEPPPASPAAETGRAVILKTDGSLLRHEGQVLEEGDQYVLTNSVLTIRLPKRSVVKVFGSVEDVYAYKLARLPDRDPDEHMKLARWCLEQRMSEQAMEQLQAVLAWNPNDSRAGGMLQNLRATADRAARRDEAIVRAGGTADAGAEGPADPAAPRELDRGIFEIRAYNGPLAKPIVFDLPDALAARRYDEFRRYIHPILQRDCASCHDETSGRRFQLIRALSDKDMTSELLHRTNLDATLALVDRFNPADSPLLVKSIVPHGPDQRSILGGPNAPAYRALMTWTTSLRHADAPVAGGGDGGVVAASGTSAPTTAGQAAPGTGFGGGFAADRGGATAPLPPPGPAEAPGSAGPTPTTIHHIQNLQGTAVHPSTPPDANFQTVSPLFGGANSAPLMHNGRLVTPTNPAPGPTAGPGAPAIPPAPGSPAAPLPGPPTAPGSPSGAVLPPGQAPAPAPSPEAGGTVQNLPDGSQLITRPDGSQVLRLADGTEAPMMDKRAVDKVVTGTERESRQFDIDPTLLQRLGGGGTASPPRAVATPPR